MNKRIFLALAVTAMIFSSGLLRAEVIDKVAIIVNNEIITMGEIDRIMAPIYQQYKNNYKGDELLRKLEEARQRIIQQLIEDRLILSEAKKIGVEVDEREIDAKVEDAQKRFGSKDNFERALGEQKVTVKELRGRYKDQMMSKKLIDNRVGSKIIINPTEISAFYEEHKSEFVRPEEVKVRNILIKVKEGMDASKAVGLARDIVKRLKTGGDFTELAKTYSEGPGASEGGMMGYARRGDLMPEIEKVVFAMNAGEVSGIIQTPLGYHIFKVEEKNSGKTLELSEVRRDVEEAIYRDKMKVKIKTWIEGLRKNAYIAFK